MKAGWQSALRRFASSGCLILTLSLLSLLCLLAFAPSAIARAQATGTPEHDAKMAWWRDARFGLFIHWGVYSVPAGVYNGHEQINKEAEWIMNRCKIPVAEYRRYAAEFNPVKFDADAWVRLAQDAGVKYIVITAKHHDGFAMFKTAASKFNIIDATPFKRDVLAELAAACRKHGMKLGFYYSQAQDWNNPGGAASRRPMSDGWDNPDAAKIDAYTAAHNGHWDPAQETRSMAAYIDQVAVPQVKELLSNYGDVAIIWWDTPSLMTNEFAQKFLAVLKEHPAVITNDRLLRKPAFVGDFKTSEQKLPDPGKPGKFDGYDIEACMTMNNTWGYRTSDQDWKSPATLVRHLMNMASLGGNFLLNVGPDALGQIPGPSVERLRAIGAWLRVNGEALYGTQASPAAIAKPAWGAVTRKDSEAANGATTTLYLTIFDWPAGGKLRLRANPNIAAAAATLLSTGAKLGFEKTGDGIDIAVPATAPDEIATVIKLELATKLPPR